jgi:hypothetical protein
MLLSHFRKCVLFLCPKWVIACSPALIVTVLAFYLVHFSICGSAVTAIIICLLMAWPFKLIWLRGSPAITLSGYYVACALVPFNAFLILISNAKYCSGDVHVEHSYRILVAIILALHFIDIFCLSVTRYLRRINSAQLILDLLRTTNVNNINIEPAAECSICLSQMGDNATALHCNHSFHHSCILQWLQHNPTCPTCRSNVFSSAAGAAPTGIVTAAP